MATYVLQRHRTEIRVDNVARLVVNVADPLGKLLGIRNCRRQKYVADFVRQQNNRFLPDDAAGYTEN